MGKLTEDFNLWEFMEHLKNMPKDRVLLDDTTKLCWTWEDPRGFALKYGAPAPVYYPESHYTS